MLEHIVFASVENNHSLGCVSPRLSSLFMRSVESLTGIGINRAIALSSFATHFHIVQSFVPVVATNGLNGVGVFRLWIFGRQ